MSNLERAGRTLDVTTTKSVAEALNAAKGAVEALGSVGTTRLRIDESGPDGFRVALKPTVLGAAHGAGYFDVMADIGIENEAQTDVHVEFSHPVVTQSRLLGLIPVGPKSVMGLAAYEKALVAIRAAVG